MRISLEDYRSKLSDWSRAIRNLAKKTSAGQAILQHIHDCVVGEGQTINLALVGAPNVGKSSLVNALVGKRLLPVSTLPSHLSFVMESVGSAEEEHYVIGNVSQPIDSLHTVNEAAASNQAVSVHVHCPWLHSRQISMKKRPALDVADDELNCAIQLNLRGVDVVLLVIDSLMPVRRSETMVMSECARRSLPLIVALNKTDRLSAEDRASTSEYSIKQVKSYASDARIVEIAVGPGTANGLELLIEKIDDVLASTNFSLVRFRQVAEELLAAARAIATQASAALEMQKKTREERNAEMRRRQFAGDEQAALWAKIENQLHERRQKLEDDIRNGLRTREQSIADLLLNDLEARTNIKAWWEKEMPFRLNRELQIAGESLSGVANRRIIADIEWLQGELVRCFRLPQSAIPIDTNVKIQGTGISQKNLALRDTNNMRIVSRLGQAAAVLVAGGLLLSPTVSGAMMALGIFAGLAADQALVYTTSKDRQKVRLLVEDMIKKASLSYALDVSQRLRAGYDEILQSLRNEQQQWEHAQTAALKLTAATNAAHEIDWARAVDESKALEQDIQETIAAVA